jgi:hypothetical protein
MFAISRGVLSGLDVVRSRVHSKSHPSSGLPDNVFDIGEKPAKVTQKRVKVRLHSL